MSIFFLTISIILFNLIIYLKFDFISKLFLIFDKPDGKLKIHSKPASLIGGLIVLINLYLIIFLLNILDINNSIFEKNFVYAVITLCTLFYIIGLVDDLKNLTPNKKLLLLIASIFFVIYLFPEINLEIIKISFIKKTYYFNNFSIFFVILSFLLLANAINMFDGINLQLILFSLFVFILFIYKGFIPLFFVLLSICLIFLAFLNFKNKVFLGDGGAYFMSALLGCTFIYQYKNYNNFIFGDEVLIILVIPAIDMLRLFIERIINKRHPFKGDLNHLHHIIYNFTKNKNITVIITIGLSIFPTFLLFFNIKTYYIFLLTLIIYLTIFSYLSLKQK